MQKMAFLPQDGIPVIVNWTGLDWLLLADCQSLCAC